MSAKFPRIWPSGRQSKNIDACLTERIRNVLESALVNRKSVEYRFSTQLSVEIKNKFMLTLNVTSLVRAVLFDNICATNKEIGKWHTFFWPHSKICSLFLAWKYRTWCWTEWSVSVAGTECRITCWSNWVTKSLSSHASLALPHIKLISRKWTSGDKQLRLRDRHFSVKGLSSYKSLERSTWVTGIIFRTEMASSR